MHGVLLRLRMLLAKEYSHCVKEYRPAAAKSSIVQPRLKPDTSDMCEKLVADEVVAAERVRLKQTRRLADNLSKK